MNVQCTFLQVHAGSGRRHIHPAIVENGRTGRTLRSDPFVVCLALRLDLRETSAEVEGFEPSMEF